MKTCTACNQSKPATKEFFHNNCERDQLASKCKECKNAAMRAKSKSNPEYDRNRKILRNYGITPAAVENMRIAQNNRCAICTHEFTTTPNIDHDHANGNVRALLCRLCNTSLGGFKDCIKTIYRAAAYLELHHARRR